MNVTNETAQMPISALTRESSLRKATASVPVLDKKQFIPAPSSEFLIIFTMICDATVLLTAFFLSFDPYHHGGFFSATREIILGHDASYIQVGTALYVVILGYLGGYNRRFFLTQRTFYIILKASFTWLVVFLAVALAFKLQPPISRYCFVVGFIYSGIFLSAWRLAFRQILIRSSWQSVLRERVLVVGWSRESDLLASKIFRDAGHHYEVIGCTPSAHGRLWVNPPRQVSILGDYNSLAEIIHNRKPSIVIMADLDPVVGEIIALSDLCEREHVQFKVIPSYFQIFTSGLQLEHVSGVPVLGIGLLPLDRVFNRIIKRAFDVVGSIAGLILSFPLILVFGYMVWRESPGPIFYSQIRSGKGGKNFRIYKLRSMKLDAETNGVQWTKQNDPRRLKIGEKMRKWNIDELPQFWNVLVGDMSLVGPRPERPEHILRFKEQISHYNARHFGPPGLTGFAQINGMRGDTDLKERIRYDLYYLENWSLFLDIYIMIRTFFTSSGAC
jgi:exopolysaccharide biosynthesis polyprenyl glycosylphosphotransferase